MSPDERDLLLIRQYIYNVLQIVFGQSPKEQVLLALFSEESLQTLSALVDDPESSYGRAVAEFEAAKSTYLEPEDAEALINTLNIEYTRLFVGPGNLPAPPWEMVYQTGRRELFQHGVLELREIYRSVGCEPAEAPHVSDDHLGIELDFMRFLCEKTLLALEQDDKDATENLMSVQKMFLEKHLLVWVPKFLADFEPAAKEPLYIASSKLLGAFIELDANSLTM